MDRAPQAGSRSSVEGRPRRVPPGLWTVTWSPTRPQLWAAAAAAALPVPHAWVSPTPRSNTRSTSVVGFVARGDELDVDPALVDGLEVGSDPGHVHVVQVRVRT